MKSDVWTKFCPNFDFTVKALMISNSLCHRNFQMSSDINVKIGSYIKFCVQNKILASKMRNLKQQRTSVFAPLILKRWLLGRIHTLLKISARCSALLAHFWCFWNWDIFSCRWLKRRQRMRKKLVLLWIHLEALLSWWGVHSNNHHTE